MKKNVDYTGRNFTGLKFDWNYRDGYVDVSMPEFVQKTLKKLVHRVPTKIQHSPHRYTPIVFGKQQQFTPMPDESPFLDAEGKRYVQSVVGSFLYYARAVDSTILPTINELGLTQANPTFSTRAKINQLLDYLHTHPNATIRYK